jgi:hypothetical protein
MDPSTSRLAMVIHQERLAEAANTRKWARRFATVSLRDQVRSALGACLIRWGEQLRVPAAPIEARL